LVSGERVFFKYDTFGRCVGGVVASNASVGAYFSEYGSLVVIVADADEVDDGVEEELVRCVMSFRGAC
jgi:hypothetical protein